MMQIELIGCTGAGKSSLAQALLCQEDQIGFHLVRSNDFILRWARLHWVKNRHIRVVILNGIALLACLFTLPKNIHFYRFVARVIWKYPEQVGIFERIKIARITARNMGIYEIVRRNESDRQIVLVDEGTIHIAHYLFVHVATEPNADDLETFIHLVSLPDVAVYVKQTESVLISRTLSRGHKRIPKDSPLMANRFIRHAQTVFEQIVACPYMEDRLVVLQDGKVIGPAQDAEDTPQLVFTRKLFELNPIP